MTTPTTPSAAAEAAGRTRRVYTAQEKAEYLALFEQSGLSAAEFSKEMAISEATFSLWWRRAREGTGQPESGPQFAEVQLSAAPPSAHPTMAVVHLPGGRRWRSMPSTT